MIDIGSLIDSEFSRNIGLLTEAEQAHLLTDLCQVRIKEEKGPLVSPACTLEASLAATEVVKILTGKKEPKPVPHYLHIDMLRRKLHKGYLWGGGKNPLLRILRHYILKEFRKSFGDNRLP
jgi:hypothetical protein